MTLKGEVNPNNNYKKHFFSGLILYFLFYTITPSANAQTESYKWGNVAMGGGGFVSGIITSKTEQDLMYIRTDVGGAYRWDATNSKWIPLLDWVSENEVGYMGVESIAIDPVETNNVYILAGTSYFNGGKTAILRSSDYGNTFSVTDVSSQFKANGNGMGRQSGEKLMVDPNSTNVLYCGSRLNGLFKSTTSGGSWSKVTSLTVPGITNGSNGISFVIIDPTSGSAGVASKTLIVGIAQTGSSNLYRSDDGGATFTAISGAPTTLLPQRAALTGDGNLYITYSNNAGPWDITGTGSILRYNLTSGTWTNVTPTGFTGAFGGISVDPADPTRLVASSLNSYLLQDIAYGDRIFLSTNGGASWTDVVARGFDIDPNGIPWIDGAAIHWAGCVEFDPFNSKKAWIISGNGIFQTDDIDATTNVWKFQSKGLEETVPLDLLSTPNGPLFSSIGDYDGFRHTDITQYPGLNNPFLGSTSSITRAAQNSNLMMRIGDNSVGNDKVAYRSEDMGLTWKDFLVKGAKGTLAFSADGKIIIHTPDGSNKTYRTADNGVNWTTVTGMTVSGARVVADPVNPNKFYVYNSVSGSMFISQDKGISFSGTGSAGAGGSTVIRTVPGNEGDIWVPLFNGGLSRSVNSGQAFSKVSGVTTCSAVGFGKEAPGKTFPAIYIYGTVGGVLGIHRSVDEGATWIRLNDDLHEYGGPGNGQFVMGDMNVYGRVYMSTVGRGIVYGESDQTCLPALITPYSKINANAPDPTQFVTVNGGDDVTLSPQAEAGGAWEWKGPGNFTSSDREITFSNTQTEQGGIYRVYYTNSAGCRSAAETFTLNVILKATGITVTGLNNATSITTKNGTLQLQTLFNPVNTTNKTVTWSITENPENASVDANGLLTASQDGNVTVRATANDGSGIFGEIIITISNQIIAAVGEPVENRFGIYPNPIASDLIINNASSITKISLYDLAGHLIFELVNNKDLIRISMTNVLKGMYILQLHDQNGLGYSKKIFKE